LTAIKVATARSAKVWSDWSPAMATPLSIQTVSRLEREPRTSAVASNLTSYAICALVFLAGMTGVLGACVALSLARLL
jgi:hypothetical protein